MAEATTADFLGGGMPIAKAKVYAPGNEPNKRNPGGVSDNALKRQKQAAEYKALDKQRAADLAAAQKATGRKMVADREAEYRRRGGFWGIALKDAKVLGPVALKGAGAVAAVIATGGAAAGALGAVSAAGVVAGATTASKVIDAVGTGQKVVQGLKKGDAAGLASAAKSGLAGAGIKTPPLPSAAKAGSQLVVGLSPPKKLVSDAKTQLATAKQLTSSAKAAVKPVVAAAKAVKPPASLVAQLDPISKRILETVPGAKIVMMKNGTVSVVTPASTTVASALFKPIVTGTKPLLVQSFAHAASQLASVVRPTTPASASAAAVKLPAPSSKPPAMIDNRPPASTGSVGSTPPALKAGFPGRPSNDPVVGATLEGYLVRLNGTIAPRGRYRAA
jgi:hypothetical protein